MNKNFPFTHFLKKSSITAKSERLESENITKSITFNPTTHQDNFEILPIEKEILSILKSQMAAEKYNAFIENIFKLNSFENNVFIFSVTTSFIKTMMDTHYKKEIAQAISKTLGKDYPYSIIVKTAPVVPGSGTNNKGILNSINLDKLRESSPKQVREPKFMLNLEPTNDDLISGVESKYLDHMSDTKNPGYLIDSKKTFDCFVIGPSNNMACATAKAVAQSPGKRGKYPSLYIYSSSGLGKTHLLHAVANGIRESNPELVICLITARDFMNEMVDHIQNNKLKDFRKKYSEKIDILMIDDIHELKNKQATQNEFFHIFNELHNKGKQLIFTSDKAPNEIDGIEERIKTRLQWGLVIDIQKPDLETRIAILKNKANELDLYLPEDLLNLIACNIKSSIRHLEGSLIKLSAFADVMKVEIDAQIIRDLLMFQDESDGREMTLETVARAVSKHFKMPLADLKSKARNKEITRARHMAMYLSHKIVKGTLLEIGRFYGGRDHTSVIHAVNKVKEILKTDPTSSRDLIEIETNL